MSVIRNLLRSGAGILVIILIIHLGLNTTSEPPIVIAGLEWNIEIGDSLIFNLNVTAESDSFNELWQSSWAHLNNTRIIANVISLPTIQPIYTSAEYIESVVMTSKVSCRFENGSMLSEEDMFIESLVSKALLPICQWEYLDQLFSDQPVAEFQMYEPDYAWTVSIDEGTLLFGKYGISWHFTKGWSTRVNMTSGVPLMIETHDNYHDAGYTNDSLQLTLVSYVHS